MKKAIFILSIISIILCLVACNKKTQNDTTKIKVPNEFIEALRNYDYKSPKDKTQQDSILFYQFAKLISDSLEWEEWYSLVNPMFVNLDDDKEEEIVALFGHSFAPILAVFKQIKKDWYLIYYEEFSMHYNEPDLQVANTFSKNKVFYVRQLYERGSGIYADGYHFYKLIDGKVCPVLQIVNAAHIFGWGLCLNQSVKSTFYIECAMSDGIWVMYDYNFFAGAVYDEDMSWDSHDDISFVKGKEGVSYCWDSISKTYKPIYSTYDKTSLTADKIACFNDFGQDSLFVNAFDYEINQTLIEGTTEEKRLLKQYLKLVKKEGQAISPTGKLEKLGETESGLSFYGTKNK